jgi:hypothetical protein
MTNPKSLGRLMGMVNPEQQVLDEIRALIAGMPEAQRLRILEFKIAIDNILRAGGDDAHWALALVGAEEAVR